ncbi:TIGR03757 family integrating conjugative element protein [Pseudomonas citronellolis]|uniref:TIGR03757 family integrating conjugative element protein n=1 Tax=Pseudomonas citronellolis TaxID=53408 RepID=UPI0021BFF94B|nr:TIGR03757 family integrating conjugative element protein [Pseudomonas citronellolis]UXJ50147.1 TIGR03757 family integrating conjugative element protein [Pseudomonas citronellolis]
MPAQLFSQPLLSRHLSAVGLLAALCPLAQAGEVLVVTDSQQSLQAPIAARVIELDLPARIEAELAARLPSDTDRSATILQQRLAAGGQTLQQRISAAYQELVEAWSLGITSLPAVVVDRHYVVYGEPDVAKAVALIEAHRGTQP